MDRISRQPPPWVPAAEIRGEGIFIQLREAQVRAWSLQPAVQGWANRFLDSHIAWRNQRYITPANANFPEMRYVLLNSLAHILMRRFTLACGYTAASIRERTRDILRMRQPLSRPLRQRCRYRHGAKTHGPQRPQDQRQL